MVVYIIVAGESLCDKFAKICLIADYLKQNLPNFCYERIEKPVIEWKSWLAKINQKNKWSHLESPLVWKELLMKGSKPYYIGGASEFMDYCYSYYEFDAFLADAKFADLTHIFPQYENKLKADKQAIADHQIIFKDAEIVKSSKNNFTVCISGAGNPLTMHLISELLDLSVGNKTISKIYIYDKECSPAFLEFVERECSYIENNFPGKVVKYIDKIGLALTNSDLFIILDHVPFNEEAPIGEWLNANRKLMKNLASMINASASSKMRILLPNLGPACFNATILVQEVFNINRNNIVVATSDLGLQVLPIIAEIAEIPMRNIFCPPVWGFVGVNHLVDIRTTIHKYNTFDPYRRYTRVKNSTLGIGAITPEMRTLEYLLFFDNTLWNKVLKHKNNITDAHLPLNKVISTVNVAKLWLFGPKPDEIVSLGIRCNGSFDIGFEGIFSQPAHFTCGEWKPAADYLLPRDAEMKLPYLEKMASMCMKMKKTELPKIVPYIPCPCKPKFFVKKGVWGFTLAKDKQMPRDT